MLKDQNLLKCYLCIEDQCQNSQKIMQDIEDTRAHWGHKSEKFSVIRENVLTEQNRERFQKLSSKKEIIQDIQIGFKTLSEEINSLLFAKQKQIEREVEQIEDSQVKMKNLYQELKKHISQIKISNLKKYEDQWQNLFNENNDSNKLSELRNQVKDKMNELNINTQQIILADLSQRTILKKFNELQQENLQLFQIIENLKSQNHQLDKENFQIRTDLEEQKQFLLDTKIQKKKEKTNYSLQLEYLKNQLNSNKEEINQFDLLFRLDDLILSEETVQISQIIFDLKQQRNQEQNNFKVKLNQIQNQLNIKEQENNQLKQEQTKSINKIEEKHTQEKVSIFKLIENIKNQKTLEDKNFISLLDQQKSQSEGQAQNFFQAPFQSKLAQFIENLKNQKFNDYNNFLQDYNQILFILDPKLKITKIKEPATNKKSIQKYVQNEPPSKNQIMK